jgi:hypothetical protein
VAEPKQLWPLWRLWRRSMRTDANPHCNSMRPWFDHLIACAIWRWHVAWKLNVTGHVLYSIFDCFFNEESGHGTLARKFISCDVCRHLHVKSLYSSTGKDVVCLISKYCVL